jgi:hypothetical protein
MTIFMSDDVRSFEMLTVLKSEQHGRKRWQKLYDAAKAAMPRAKPEGARVLIEVAAQHPLRNGEPGPEFTARLDRAIELFQRLVQNGNTVEIYVPGSRHRYEGSADPVSLSAAGVAFLKGEGIPAEVLHGDDLNDRYAGATGVYCSMDECFVTAEYFRDGHFDRLLVVLSPYQVFRKAFHYFEFGVCAEIHAVSTESFPFHDPIKEFFALAPLAVLKDDGAGNTYERLVEAWRRERRPV